MIFFGKPLHTFPDHALAQLLLALGVVSPDAEFAPLSAHIGHRVAINFDLWLRAVTGRNSNARDWPGHREN